MNLRILFYLVVQTTIAPAYLQRGDAVEQQFRDYHSKLNDFYFSLRSAVSKEAPDLMAALEGEPPKPVLYGYQLLPKLFDEPRDTDPRPLEFRSYSWPLTEQYIRGETTKLQTATSDLKRVGGRAAILRLIESYRDLVKYQDTIDQHIEYNRFWQRAVASDRPRYDQLTQVYEALQRKDPELSNVIRDVLGKPDVPAFIQLTKPSDKVFVLRVPVYTDIADAAFLDEAKRAIESLWKAEEGGIQYRVDVQWRKFNPTPTPAKGAHIDVRQYAALFPSDGAAFITGAESTHAFVGKFVALGTGNVSYRTVAHEFGHILGFRDGYVRGYKDLGKDGFEILEVTPSFDDLMSAPRQGSVQATHFKLILDALPK